MRNKGALTVLHTRMKQEAKDKRYKKVAN